MFVRLEARWTVFVVPASYVASDVETVLNAQERHLLA